MQFGYPGWETGIINRFIFLFKPSLKENSKRQIKQDSIADVCL